MTRALLAILAVAGVYITSSLALFAGIIRLLSRQVHPEEN